MKNLKLLVLAYFLVIIPGMSQEKSSESDTKIVSTFYFIRHAEKDRSDASNENPHLLDIGKQRAERWKDVLKNITFDAVYSTNYHRTKETALPTALNNNLELTIYNPKTIDISSFLKVNEGKDVLVVGHSNTTPQIVNSILKNNKYNNIEDHNNGNLYILTVYKNHVSDVLLYINQ